MGQDLLAVDERRKTKVRRGDFVIVKVKKEVEMRLRSNQRKEDEGWRMEELVS